MSVKRKRTISFCVNPEQYQALKEKAAERGTSPGKYARDVTLGAAGVAPFAARGQGLDEGVARLDLLVRKAAWALIVALHPEWEEAEAKEFVERFLP